ncbi:MAG: hypothetical protein A3G18_01340 [Rhodospirillales bacterium RIFCSPLOWO2_12_FULL_58_28]|nr:MAG: hypothetical protein A3H92_04540 [Rhodospirillales bacterium RIFCSPLOWO2_02_FULL_58_16]OHC78044.1 MAG: hypothetical protein A3G18_01340 [Rhodospirillales bacterium RIFCSPLOWO2_12_FULL_58_28]
MTIKHQDISLGEAMEAIAPRDRHLIRALFTLSLAALFLGLFMGLWAAMARNGIARPELPETGYRVLTMHGVAVFFHWLSLAQGALLLVLAAKERRAPLALNGLGWAGGALMLIAFALQATGTLSGTPLLYDGSPELAGEERLGAFLFYLGYLVQALGLAALTMPAIATLMAAKRSRGGEWSGPGFGAVLWGGLVLVSAATLANAFLPAALWAAGWEEFPADHVTLWHVLFHNMHYLPLLGAMLAWTLLLPEISGARSVFGSNFSKIVFTLYLVFVPPTSLYHMFLEPGLDPLVLVLGSLLSLFIGVPTIAAFLVTTASLEAHARAKGAKGWFGWIRSLDWSDPATNALGAAVVNLALGGILAFVLIQEKLAGLLSDTFFVPGAFHFITLGVVTMTLLAVMLRLLPHLTGQNAPAPKLLSRLPWLITAGLLLFGLAGAAAGAQGMPRRVLDAGYEGAAPVAWTMLSQIIGAGAAVMAVGLVLLTLGAALPLVGLGRKAIRAKTALAPAPEPLALRQAAWGGSTSVAFLLFLMGAATWAAFTLMTSLPVIAGGAAGH